VDLQGDAVTYDFQIARTPTFGQGDIVVNKTGLKEHELTLEDAVSPGTYYWRVIARDAKDPAKNWQISFSEWESADGKQKAAGVKQVTL
jgi:hypothetical protein